MVVYIIGQPEGFNNQAIWQAGKLRGLRPGGHRPVVSRLPVGGWKKTKGNEEQSMSRKTKSRKQNDRRHGVPQGQKDAGGSAEISTQPRALGIGNRGIRTGKDFADFMSALMTDAVNGSLPPNIINAACNAGGKLLKIAEMSHRHGRKPETENPPLQLSGG